MSAISAVSALPHPPQKRSSGIARQLQSVHIGPSGMPQLVQKRTPPLLVKLHDWHFIPDGLRS
jgi:hypothetical protein